MLFVSACPGSVATGHLKSHHVHLSLAIAHRLLYRLQLSLTLAKRATCVVGVCCVAVWCVLVSLYTFDEASKPKQKQRDSFFHILNVPGCTLQSCRSFDNRYALPLPARFLLCIFVYDKDRVDL